MKKDDCIFCKLDNYVIENEYAYGIYDINPVTEGHMLVILKEHKDNIFETSMDERVALLDLVDEAKRVIDAKYAPDGYNVTTNVGRDAGQSVMHVHIHVIPRYKDESKDVKCKVKKNIPVA